MSMGGTAPDPIPGMTPRQLLDAAWARLTEHYIVDTRTNRIGNKDSIEWKDKRIHENDAMYRGDWIVALPDETSLRDVPMIQNLQQVATDDLARLVADNNPRVFSPPLGPTDPEVTAGRIREMAMKTYWKRGRGEQLRPWLAQDLALTGTAFLNCIYPTDKKRYPKPFRIDPRGCFPDVINGELQDLIVLQRVRARQAEMLLNVNLTGRFGSAIVGSEDDIEIVDYFCKQGQLRVLTMVANNEPMGSPWMHSSVRYDLDQPAVAFTMLNTGDGHFRGLYDQIKGILGAENRMATLMRDYGDQGVYAPWFEFNVQNAEEKPGPRTVYHGLEEKSRMERVQPAISSPQVFQEMEFFANEARAGASRPSSREGDVPQSQASGAFVDTTTGSLTTMVRDVGRKLGALQSDWFTIALQMDELYGNVEKSLWRPVGKTYTYRPKRDIGGIYDNEVLYGTGAGLDYQNRKAAIMQEIGAKLLSKDSGRAQMDDIADPDAEEIKIEREDFREAYLQRLANQDDPTEMRLTLKYLNKGDDFFTAAGKAADEIAAQQQAAAQGGQGEPGAGLAAGQEPAGPPQPMVPGGAPTPGAPQAPAPPFLPNQQLPEQVYAGR